MRFGLEFGSYPADLDPAGVCKQVSLRARVAHQNNYEALFVAQHYLTGRDAAILQSIHCWLISPARCRECISAPRSFSCRCIIR